MKLRNTLKEFAIITFGTIIVATAVFFFMLPSHVSVGSVSAFAMVLSNFIPLPISVISLVIAVLYQLYPQSFPIANLAAHRLGNPYVYYVTAVSNTLVILLLCRKFLGRSKVLSYFGRNSLIVMALHMDLTIRIAWWFYPKLHMNFGERIDSLIIIAMELVMFPIINTLINKCFPFILRPKKS